MESTSEWERAKAKLNKQMERKKGEIEDMETILAEMQLQLGKREEELRKLTREQLLKVEEAREAAEHVEGKLAEAHAEAAAKGEEANQKE